VIGEGTVVEDSVIGPDVAISYGCTVRGSEIEDSIVMEQCTIEDVRSMAGSILGRGVDVRRATRPEMYRLIVGDHSQVRVY
jgi:glucose-1-phosphate thymidylyltransferase